MKKFLFFLLVFISLFSIFSCKKSFFKEKGIPDLTKETITGEKLWERISKEDNYKKYPTWPEYEGMQPGKSPHGRFHKIYINPRLRNSLPLKEKITPIGSIIVKENYTPDEELGAYTVMAKVKDYNTNHNDWFWVKYDKNGKVLAEGKFDMCINCHIGSKNNDYLIIYKLDKPLK